MIWGAPLLAGIVAAIAIPALLILYFLKLRRKTVEISTTLLWRQAIQDLQANAPFQKLRKNILLLLQLLALAAVILAIAQPRSNVEASQGKRYVLMIDRSASMSAIDPETGKTRLELAKEAATEAIDAMSDGGVFGSAEQADQAMILAFDSTGDPLTKFTGDKNQLRAAVESIRPTDSLSSIAEAYKLAQAGRPKRVLLDDAGGTSPDAEELEIEGLVQGPAITFQLYSDGRIADLGKVILREDKNPGSEGGGYADAADSFEYFAIGSPDAVNLAITSVGAERDYENPEQITIFVGVQSNDPSPRNVDVEFEIDGQTLQGIRTVELDGAEPEGGIEGARRQPSRSGIEFKLEDPSGFLARIRLRFADSGPDALMTDNEVLVPVPPARQTSVAIVTSGNLFLTSALKGMPLAELVTWTPAQYDAARASGAADRFDVFLLDGVVPPTDDVGSVLPGRYLVLGAVPPPPFGVVDLGETGPESFVTWSRTHPVLRDVSLDPVRVIKGRAVEIPDGSGATVMAELVGGPGMLELSRGGARAVVVPWDVGQSNWPFNVGFVVFLASAVDYLSTDAASAAEMGGASRLYSPGQILSARLPKGATEVRVKPPEGDAVTVTPASDGTVVYGPLQRTGLYRVSWGGEPGPTDVVSGSRASRIYTANLLNPDESDLATLKDLDLGSREVTATDRTAERVREYWPWLLLVALGMMMLEWYVFNRKVHL
ncbi:MAG: hypothetical protein ACI89L_001085 [Phycisphaerales bacterium]|jgi:hypothetical protein